MIRLPGKRQNEGFPKRPWMVESQVYGVLDEIKDGSLMVEWGAGASTPFWLENSGLSQLYSIEHNEEWFELVRKEVEKYGNRVSLLHCPLKAEATRPCHEDVRYADEYATASIVPLDAADVILVDGHCRNICMAHAGMMAKPGAILFLHDSQEIQYYGWGIRHIDSHPDWRRKNEWKPLPEEPDSVMSMTSWVRIA